MNGRDVRLALEKLGKWRRVFVSWQVGSRRDTDPEANAIADHREVTIMLRAEMTALVGLLIKKGVFSVEDWTSAVGEEAVALDQDYERAWPGFSTGQDGVRMAMPQAMKTMEAKHFLP